MNTENPYESPWESEEAPIEPTSRREATEVAKLLLENMQRTFQPKHLYRVVDGSDFRRVSQRFYRKTQARLEALGFSFVGDIEDVTLKVQTPDPRTFIRTMLSRDRTVVAAFYHISPMLLWRLAMLLLRIPAKIIEFESYTTSVRVSTVQQFIHLQNQMETQLHEHLHRIGWVTKEYLLAQGVRKGIVDEVYEEAQRLLGRAEKSG